MEVHAKNRFSSLIFPNETVFPSVCEQADATQKRYKVHGFLMICAWGKRPALKGNSIKGNSAWEHREYMGKWDFILLNTSATKTVLKNHFFALGALRGKKVNSGRYLHLGWGSNPSGSIVKENRFGFTCLGSFLDIEKEKALQCIC